MIISSIKSPKVSVVPEFSTELDLTFMGKIFAPSHSPCWCIKPSWITNDATMLEILKSSEAEQCSVTSYPFVFLVSDATLERPTTGQLSSLESWHASINYEISKLKAELLEGF